MENPSNEALCEAFKTADDMERKELLSDLYQKNYGLIRTVCIKYQGVAEFEDLMQEAFFGLRLAVEKYDASQGVPFSHYVPIWIRQVLSRYIIDRTHTVRLPDYMYQDCMKYRKAVSEYEKMHGAEPSDADIARMLKLTGTQFEKLKKHVLYMSLVSLDAAPQTVDDGSVSILDTIEDPEAGESFSLVMDQIDNEIRSAEIWAEVDRLGEVPSEVIHRRFQNCETLDSIGVDINANREGVRQIQMKAFARLRKSAVIQSYRDEYTKAYTGTGLSSFRRTGTSSTERTAIEHYSGQVWKYQKKVDDTMKSVQKKSGIEVGSEYIDKKVKEYEDSLKATVNDT